MNIELQAALNPAGDCKIERFGWTFAVSKSVFPDVDFAPIAESFGFKAATIRSLEELHKLAATLRKPDGPIFLDCKINADVAAPFMSEFAQFEGRH